MIKATSTVEPIPIQVVSSAIQNSFKSVTRTELDYFQAEKERWIKAKEASPQITEKALTWRLAEIERDGKLFGEDAVAVLIEGLTEENIPVRCLIGEKFFTAKYPRILTDAEKKLSLGVFPRLQSILLNITPSVKFEVFGGNG